MHLSYLTVLFCFLIDSDTCCVFVRKLRKEVTVHRNAVLETADMTAGTLREVSLSLPHDTLETTP